MKRISIYCLLMFCALLTASAQQTKQLVILHTSDTHSRIEPIDQHAADPYAGAGGVVRRATFLKDFRTKICSFFCASFIYRFSVILFFARCSITDKALAKNSSISVS